MSVTYLRVRDTTAETGAACYHHLFPTAPTPVKLTRSTPSASESASQTSACRSPDSPRRAEGRLLRVDGMRSRTVIVRGDGCKQACIPPRARQADLEGGVDSRGKLYALMPDDNTDLLAEPGATSSPGSRDSSRLCLPAPIGPLKAVSAHQRKKNVERHDRVQPSAQPKRGAHFRVALCTPTRRCTKKGHQQAVQGAAMRWVG